MNLLGEFCDLKVVSIAPVGVYLGSGTKEIDNILLPRKQVPEETELGDTLHVFIYKDSEDRLIATVNTPKLTLGEMASLKVVDIAKIGAFLDWGLEKDLLLPYKEQKGSLEIGQNYLVSLYIDKSDRLCATMDVYNKLTSECPYEVNDKVTGIICDINEEMGAFVAIDNKFHGLIPNNELFHAVSIGECIEGRITKIREDGKAYISLREKAYIQMDDDAAFILERLTNNNGYLNLNDKSSPEKIKAELSMSKKAFKRAVGRLLKENKIAITESGIKIKTD